MAEQANPGAGTASAAPPASLADQIREAVASAMSSVIEPLKAEIAVLKGTTAASVGQPQTPPTGRPGESPAITAAEVQKIVQSTISTQLAAHVAQQQASASREAYTQGKMADLPVVYRKQLGNDPAKWEGEEQAIRAEFRADLAKAGVKPPAVTGDPASNTARPPAAAVDYSKLSASQLIANGIAEAKPVAPPPAVAAK